MPARRSQTLAVFATATLVLWLGMERLVSWLQMQVFPSLLCGVLGGSFGGRVIEVGLQTQL